MPLDKKELDLSVAAWREHRAALGYPVADDVPNEPAFVQQARQQWPTETARVLSQADSLAQTLKPYIRKIATLEARIETLEKSLSRPPSSRARVARVATGHGRPINNGARLRQ